MPANRQPRSMDKPYYDWSPISGRPPLRWPNGARVALCVIVSLESVQWQPPEDAFLPPSFLVQPGCYPAIPDIHETSHHEYGNRVGVFRVMRVLDKYGIKGTAALDAGIAERYPFIVGQCQQRGWEFIGHGVSFSQMITERMTEQEEREHIRRCLDAVERATGQAPMGWVGADYGESTRTVGLLAEMGVRYVCDWPNDEQPYTMKVPKGQMVSLPVMLELDEVYTHRGRTVSIHDWRRMVTEAFDRLNQDGASSGRLLVLNLHPYLIGQPYRIKYLDQALGHIMGQQGVWAATGREIVEWYLHQND